MSSFSGREGILRAALGALHPVESLQQGTLVRGAEIDEDATVVQAAPGVDVGQTLEEAPALRRRIPFREHEIDELGDLHAGGARGVGLGEDQLRDLGNGLQLVGVESAAGPAGQAAVDGTAEVPDRLRRGRGEQGHDGNPAEQLQDFSSVHGARHAPPTMARWVIRRRAPPKES